MIPGNGWNRNDRRPPENEADRALAAVRPDPAPLPPDRARAVFEAAVDVARSRRQAPPDASRRAVLTLAAPSAAVVVAVALVAAYRRQPATGLWAARPFLATRGAATLTLSTDGPAPPRGTRRYRLGQRRPARLLALVDRPGFGAASAVWRVAPLPRPPAALEWRAAALAEATAFRAPLPEAVFVAESAESAESEAPSLRVVARNAEPVLRLTVRYAAPPSQEGYARVAAVRFADAGSMVWSQSTMSGTEATPDLVMIGQTLTAWRSTPGGATRGRDERPESGSPRQKR